MNRIARRVILAVSGCVAGLSAGACGSGISSDTTLSEALQALSNNPLLSRITVGDIVQGFSDFLAGQDSAALSAAEEAELQSLQARLDGGQIDGAQFESLAQGLIGDRAPRRAFGGFGFFGSMFGHNFRGLLADELALTDEQIAQARAIFEAAHADIRALRQAAHQDIYNNVLTDEQRALLDDLREQFEARRQDDRQDGETTDMPNDDGTAAQPDGPMHGRRPFLRRMMRRLADELELTDEQIAQIQTIRMDLRAAVRARHEQARVEFRAILTDEQLAVLDAFENRTPAAEGQ